MNRKWWSAGILALVVVLGAGCGNKPQAQPNDGQSETVTVPTENVPTENVPEENVPTTNGSGGGNSTEGDQQTPADASKKESIKVYFTDPEAMELIESTTEITFVNESQKYEEAFKALQKSDNAELISLWGKIELLSLDFKGDAITMDINLPDEARLGSGGEMFALEALQNTMFQFDEVKSVELLVNGAKIESLMGHVDLEHPMMKN
ncbi:GerMN domain-containing protein [Paenibacillus sp. FA6]|uniref:GerMN domain-containing protein n=1 Tax=Paenibacillus sp. FA6 TaxID=3413029 RepID=UPI003F658FC1